MNRLSCSLRGFFDAENSNIMSFHPPDPQLFPMAYFSSSENASLSNSKYFIPRVRGWFQSHCFSVPRKSAEQMDFHGSGIRGIKAGGIFGYHTTIKGKHRRKNPRAEHFSRCLPITEVIKDLQKIPQEKAKKKKTTD